MTAVTARSESEIADDIMKAIHSQKLTDNGEINITVKDGIVTIKGTVGSYITSSNIEFIAYATPGVVAVDNQLSIVY
jgi:osmotically-inducible protein OsmY